MQKRRTYFFLSLLFISILGIGYLVDRKDFLLLICFALVSGLSYGFILAKGKLSIPEIVGFAILIRLALLFYTPNLSDDYNRFVWDGEMILQAENPYLILPKEHVLSNTDTDLQLVYEGLNSKQYYTVYPSFNQAIFATARFLGRSSIFHTVFWLKAIVFLFEIATLFLLLRFLRLLKLPETKLAIYGLNPLVIIELVGNVHFEGVMGFFLLLSLCLLFQNKVFFAAIAMAFAIHTKLLPLLLLPLFIRYLGFKKSIFYFLVIGLFCIAMFLPFLSSQLIQNFGSSIDLYFQNFEFNASIYYIIRYIGFQVKGYNIIQEIGYILPLVVLSVLAILSILMKKNNTLQLLQSMSIVLFVYYLFASIVHPWYIINLVILAVFTAHRFVLVWSITAYFSYFAYSEYVISNFNWDKHQSDTYFFAVFLEYLIVFIALFVTIKRKDVLLSTKIKSPHE